MKIYKIYLLLFFFIFYQKCFADECKINSHLYKKSIINNVLNLSEEQLKLQDCNCENFRKLLTRDQRIKYDMINKLQKDDRKKSIKKKNFYKSNPQMRPFGNPTKCSNKK